MVDQMNITVDYLPMKWDELLWPKTFESEERFHNWLAEHVCSDCTDALLDEHGFPDDGLFTVKQLLNTGCGCELSVERQEGV